MTKLLVNLLHGASSVLKLSPTPTHRDLTHYVARSDIEQLNSDVLRIRGDYVVGTQRLVNDRQREEATR